MILPQTFYAYKIDAQCFGIFGTGLVERKVNGILLVACLFWSGRKNCLDADLNL